MNDTTILVLVVVLSLLAIFVIPRWLLNRAIHRVIRIFRERDATDTKNAKTIYELGLAPQSMMQRMFRGRDYKPDALNALLKAQIIQTTESGRLYLSEERLIESGLERGASHYR